MPKYKGPTSGRIRIGSDGEVTKESFTDQPLSAAESRDTAWFRELSPIAQFREARRLKWNLEEAERGLKAALNRARSAESEVGRLEQKLASFTPDGYTLPGSASVLVTWAEAHGWKTGRAWRDRTDGFGDHLLRVRIGRSADTGLRWDYDLSWSCTPTSGRFTGGIFRTPERFQWADAPSLTEIRRVIADNPVKAED
jgi:hypothetical protein